MRRLALVALLALAPPPRQAETVVPNDNRLPAGAVEGGVLRLRLVARSATWHPTARVDTTVTVLAFAEEGGAPRIPGPLLRAHAGAEVRVSVRNDLDSTLVVHGLRGGTGIAVADDTLQLAPRAEREVAFRAGAPGSYLYWGTTTRSPLADRPWRDSQLTGAIVVDPAGARPDPAERILVITVLDLFPDDTVRNRKKEDVFERAINGRSWPDGERLAYAVGDTVRWRWLNGSYLPHPMHLHGFHFDVTARGERNADTTYAPDARRTVVTELMVPGSTFAMQWVPTRAGRWLMHCHMRAHVTPFPERPDSARAHDAHDVERHATTAMEGLVLGVAVRDRDDAPAAIAVAERAPARRLRLLAQQRGAATPKRQVPRGFVLQRGAPPRADSVEVPGAPIVLTRGETVGITVVNRLREPTTVHWHGMELESVYDGVSGWSRTRGSVAPLVAPGDSFAVAFTPPRAGTFIYHTHMDEGPQLVTGMYGPLLVLEPGEPWDPAADRVVMIGDALDGDTVPRLALNGRRAPPPITLAAGRTARLRLVNIHPNGPAVVRLTAASDTVPLRWRPRAKDGVDLPATLRAERPARLGRFGVGETYDFDFTPARAMDAVLSVTVEGQTRRLPVRVR
ncbi:multicopper oxidase domain-containing protein [Roseisolibacter sp. H3M3-2]|uniref:multicopper oxidase domain-containing protein n=1 Tax=Roseisolibacter sp. H3M3-2 TaxID=3031323 RepID=UPI0023D9BC2C|nr:multicopper oxidase domain-containing protein [Roseisolibacter sp. H3M3-2]MDF1505981.1 multicopper oxidase domain-containing protein [Roseisolibacter sp. H3M3-2]